MTTAGSWFYTFNRGARNSIACFYLGHGRRCRCAFSAPPPDPAPAPAPAPPKAPRPKSTSTAARQAPNPDIIYAPGDLPNEPATPDTPTGTPAGPICIGDDGEPLISLRLANRYFMLLWGAILRGVAPFPEARNAMAATLDAYSRFYPGPFATGP